MGVFDRAPEKPQLRSGQIRAVEVAAPFQQIVGLIDQEDIPASVQETREPGLRMKGIIVVSDHDIGEFRRVHGERIRADPVPFSTVRDPAWCEGHAVRRPLQQVPQGPVDAVVVALRPRTGLRPAVDRLLRAGTFLRRYHDTAYPQPPRLQQGQRLQGRLRCDCPGRQVPDVFRLALADRFQGGKEDCHGLAGPCRCLQEELSALRDRVVDTRRQGALSLPVGEGKVHFPYR